MTYRYALGLAGCASAVLLGQVGRPQTPPAPRAFVDRAVVQHEHGVATTVANDPRPLSQAITAISEEYGWAVSFEDPPYQSALDLVDDTDPGWRRGHPDAKGVRIIAGGAFRCDYEENANTATSSIEEEHVLAKVIADYNRSGNPGKFRVVRNGDASYSVVGMAIKADDSTDRAVTAVLDTPVTVPALDRSVWETIGLVLHALSEKTGFNVVRGTIPINAMMQSKSRVGGENVPARVLLTQALASTGRSWVWRFLFDADRASYAMNIRRVQIAQYDKAGNRRTSPVDEVVIQPTKTP
jgi:hypothetical protein